jgi:hypothetical protein
MHHPNIAQVELVQQHATLRPSSQTGRLGTVDKGWVELPALHN